MEDRLDPRTNALSVLARTNGILMDRIREEQLRRLEAERKDRYALIDLRYGLERRVVRYLRPKGQESDSATEPAEIPQPEAEPVVPEETQLMLARVRTDLDSFNDLEAGALMADGYLIAKSVAREPRRQWLKPSHADVPVSFEGDNEGWWFSQMVDLITRPEEGTKKPSSGSIIQALMIFFLAPFWSMTRPDERMKRQLSRSSKRAFKVFFLAPFWATAFAVGIYGGLAALLYWLYAAVYSGSRVQAFVSGPISESVVYWLPALVVVFLLIWLFEVLGRKFPLFYGAGRGAAWVLRIIFRAVPSPLIFVIARIHLLVFDWLYLKCGELK
jgi:NTE family protein